MAQLPSDFYEHPEYQTGQERKLLLLQVDIEGHSRLSKEHRPADVMKMKVELAELLGEQLRAQGFKGMGWQGDGGMFALDVSDNVALLDKAVSAWRPIRHIAKIISKNYQHLFGEQLIALRSSAHVCRVYVHPDPRYWHAEGINSFAKAERDLGRRDEFVITGELYRELPQESKQEFELLSQSVSVGERTDTYKFSAGVPGDRNMDFIPTEIKSINREAKSFRAALAPSLQNRIEADLNTQSVLFVVDLQEDFSSDRPLAVKDARKIAKECNKLIVDALSKGIAVVVTRDWHPTDFSFDTWPRHCEAGSGGAAFLPELKFSDHEANVQVANIGANKDVADYNPYCDSALQSFMAMRAPATVYVAGIALEYCVLSTCLVSKAYTTNVIALEDFIRSAKADQANVAWSVLKNGGVQRINGNPFA